MIIKIYTIFFFYFFDGGKYTKSFLSDDTAL